MKSTGSATVTAYNSLSPCGESGLKLIEFCVEHGIPTSLPMRGEWIEMAALTGVNRVAPSLPMRGEWIEISTRRAHPNGFASLPKRGEWI